MNSKLRYLLVDIFRLSRIGFARNVAVLAGGTSLAQAIIILTSPILTRLFSPEDFGLLGVYTTVISILLVIVAWRYELAVVLPKEERTAINLLILALLIVIFMCSLVGLLLVVFGSQIVTWLDVRLLYPFLWFFPLGLLGGGVYQVLSFWAVRKGTFGTLAKTRLTQNAGQAITQILLGLLHVGPLGLVFGDVVGRMGGTATLWRQAWKQDKGLLRDVSISSLKSVAYQYRSFPILSSGSSLLNIAGLQLPMLFLVFIYGPQVAGWFALGQRIIGIPLSIIGNSVAQVYLGEASGLLQDNPSALQGFFTSTQRKLSVIGAIPIGLLALGGPWLISFIFGNDWGQAGVYLQLLALMHVAKFVASTLAQTLIVVERQDLQLYWDTGRLFLVLLCFIMAYYLDWIPSTTLGVYGASMFVAYLIQMMLIRYALNKKVTFQDNIFTK